MSIIVKILNIENSTYNVLHITAEKPEGINYVPGQAVDVAINKEGWQNEVRPFTFTSLPQENTIQFTIKTYTDHNGVTNELRTLKPGDSLLIGDVFGDIHYKKDGVFIAGGAGITPFISIFRSLEKQGKIGNNKLIFANKSKADIINYDYFLKILGNNFINVLSDENIEGYEHGYITEELIKKIATAGSEYFYLCGPPPMMSAVEKQLKNINVQSERIVKEDFA
ncbi:MAG: flavodoxin reductase [Bacteroidetes bacterium]|nr:flavodoxin reductase [Bacteroidota bacterium]